MYAMDEISREEFNRLFAFDKSEETYFGLHNDFKTEVVKLFENLIDKYKYYMTNNTKSADNKKIFESMESTFVALEDCIAKNINAETVKISVFSEVNAFCYPMCVDGNLSKSLKQRRDIVTSLEDIVESKDGFRFKEKKGKVLVFGFGLGFFVDDKYTAEEMAAILFHEMGHALQHMLVGINYNTVSIFATNYINMAYHGLNFINNLIFDIIGFNIFKFIADVIGVLVALGVSVAGYMDKYTLNKGDDDDIEKKGYDYSKYIKIDREKEGEKATKNRDEDIEKFAKREKKHNKVLEIIFKFFIKTFMGFLRIFTPITVILATIPNLYLLTNLSFLRKERRYEQFADSFATFYGLGPEQSSALKKLHDTYNECDLGLFNFINIVPLLNVVVSSSNYFANSIQSLLNGYPTSKGRIVGIYKELEYELNNNKDLTESTKNDLKKQLEEVSKVYDDFIYAKGLPNLTFKIFHILAKSNIKKEKSDVIENVQRLLDEYQKEGIESNNNVAVNDKLKLAFKTVHLKDEEIKVLETT